MSAELAICASCGRRVTPRRAFLFNAGREVLSKCMPCALRHRPMLRRSLLASIIVGSILAALNHGDLIFTGNWESDLSWKVPLTYLVPFCVATFGALSNSRR